MILRICTALVFLSSLVIVNPVSVPAQRTREVKVYLVAVG